MKSFSTTMIAGALVCLGGLRAESPRFAEPKEAYSSIRNNLIQMAEKMPEENYSFQPTPDIRTYPANLCSFLGWLEFSDFRKNLG
jgi:hypothetical protein